MVRTWLMVDNTITIQDKIINKITSLFFLQCSFYKVLVTLLTQKIAVCIQKAFYFGYTSKYYLWSHSWGMFLHYYKRDFFIAWQERWGAIKTSQHSSTDFTVKNLQQLRICRFWPLPFFFFAVLWTAAATLPFM